MKCERRRRTPSYHISEISMYVLQSRAPVRQHVERYVYAVSGEHWKYELYDIDYMLCDNVLYVLYRLCIHILLKEFCQSSSVILYFPQRRLIWYAWRDIPFSIIFPSFPDLKYLLSIKKISVFCIFNYPLILINEKKFFISKQWSIAYYRIFGLYFT